MFQMNLALLLAIFPALLPTVLSENITSPCDNNGYMCNVTEICIGADQDCNGGYPDCPYGEDELNCDERRCPLMCRCRYSYGSFEVLCHSGWNNETFLEVPGLTTYLSMANAPYRIVSYELLAGLQYIDTLTISQNYQVIFEPGTFYNQSSIRELYLGNNAITDISGETFDGLLRLELLHLNKNYIRVLRNGTFRGIGYYLRELDLQINLISVIETGVFDDIPLLTSLDLNANYIVTRSLYSLRPITFLTSLHLAINSLTTLTPDLMRPYRRLTNLYLNQNYIQYLHSTLFRTQTRLRLLHIGHNNLSSLELGTFDTLSRLFLLNFANNSVPALEPGIFDALTELQYLVAKDNKITSLNKDVFRGLTQVKYMDLSGNGLEYLEPGIFDDLYALQFIDLRRNSLTELDSEILQNKSELQYVGVDEDWMCCLVSNVSCDAGISAVRPLFYTCGRLLQSLTMRVFIWLQGIGAVLGNLSVLTARWKKRRGGNWVQSSLITNLSAADLMMGFYLILIATADSFFGDSFFSRAHKWRDSIMCKFAGMLAILSSEASLFFVALISADRFIGVVFPFSRKRLSKRSTCISIIMLWSFALALGVTATLLSNLETSLYQASNVCLGLPFERAPPTVVITRDYFGSQGLVNETPVETQKGQPASIFSIVIFLGVNLICILFVLICYICIGINVRISGRQTNRNSVRTEEIRMAIRMGFIVGTDFFCWMPVILMGILSQAKLVIIPDSMYAWSVILILPLNSCLNPYLYTMSPIIANRLDALTKKIRGDATSKDWNGPNSVRSTRPSIPMTTVQ